MQAYYTYSSEELMEKAKLPVFCMDSSEATFRKLAEEIVSVIERNNSQGTRTVIICPVGPAGPLPLFCFHGQRGPRQPEKLLVLQHGRIPSG